LAITGYFQVVITKFKIVKDFLTDKHRLFLSLLRVTEEVFPGVDAPQAVTGRKAYAIIHFMRAFLAKSFFKTGTNRDLILYIQNPVNH